MAMILKYRKITDKYTTHCLREPDYNLLGTDKRVVELCTIDGNTYVAVPDGLVLPDQPEMLGVEKIELTDGLREDIKAVSPHIKYINQRVVEMIRQRYDINDEIKMLRIGPSEETAKYNDYAEACREWGRNEKIKLGL